MAVRKYRQLGKEHLRIFKFWKTSSDYYRLSIPLRKLRTNYKLEALPVYCIEDEIEALKEQLHSITDEQEFEKTEMLISFLKNMLDKYRYKD